MSATAATHAAHAAGLHQSLRNGVVEPVLAILHTQPILLAGDAL